MGRSGDTAETVTEREDVWGTWEELLLVSAVSRHGTASWDSIAMEVQSRSPSAHLLTPHSCRLRFRHLRRRFSSTAAANGIDGETDVSDAGDDPNPADALTWVEELRKLRVAELRREVEQYDLSIVSLQLKVERLKEERERSLKEAEPGGDGKSDLKDEENKENTRSPRSAAEEFAGDRISGEDSGRSWKESNSTDLKEERKSNPGGKTAELSGTGDRDIGSAAGDAGKETSYDGSSGAAAKGRPAGQRGGDTGESVAESKEGEAEKESSDVQSSASLSRRRRKAASGGGGDEVEAEEVSLVAAESQPLVAFLEIIQSNKYGSVFERRLETQDIERYRSLIRRHVDLDLVRTKLESGRSGGGFTAGGAYGSPAEFYRDLLLLCTNALVFFPKNSPESTAAGHLRSLVSAHLASSSLLKRPSSTADESKHGVKVEQDLARPVVGAPIIVCRKRSSVVKAAAAAAKEEKSDPSLETFGDHDMDRKRTTRERSKGLRTNKTRGANPNPNLSSGTKPPKSGDSSSGKGSDKNATSASVVKKRNAVDFLNRMNQGSPSPSSRVSLLETLKKGKAEGRKEQGGGSGKKAAAPGKRSVGRPPKRAAPSVTPPPAKRIKEDLAKTPPAGQTSRRRGGRR